MFHDGCCDKKYEILYSCARYYHIEYSLLYKCKSQITYWHVEHMGLNVQKTENKCYKELIQIAAAKWYVDFLENLCVPYIFDENISISNYNIAVYNIYN